MGFEITGVFHVKSCLAVGLPDQTDLRVQRRLGDSGGSSVLVCSRSPDDTPDDISITYRIRQPLKDQGTSSFSAGITIGSGIEAVTFPVWGKESQTGQRNGILGAVQKATASNYALATCGQPLRDIIKQPSR